MNKQLCLRDQQSSESSNFPQVKCDFCDITFWCDLDVSRHLTSNVHAKNVDEFLSMQNLLSKDVQKELPKNLTQVFQSLKLRHVKDLKDLADKGFFEIIDEPIAEIAEELATTLFESVVDFETKDFRPRHRAMILDAFSHDRESTSSRADPSSKNQNSTAKKTVTQSNTSNTALNSANLIPKVEPTETIPKPKISAAKQSVPSTAQSTSANKATSARPTARENQSRVRSKDARSTSTNSSALTNENTASRSGQVKGPASAASTGNQKSSSKLKSSSAHSQANTSSSTNTSKSRVEQQANTFSKPVPRLDSTYVPAIAIVKSEPKD